MPEVLLFIKDFELGSRISSVCIDFEKDVEFSDETTDPMDFSTKAKLAVIDMDEKVFSSVGLISELKRHGLKIVGTMKKINNKENSKLKSAGCDIIISKSSLVKNMPTLLAEYLS
ncbi:MAG: hypothetical protein ACKVHA_00595 [Fidelibacterota bacterium]|jgi:hypothetical protein|tara:strand:- start:3254 stop:3598 length:345 start_codon:yes stop_codon:yes gene_type:complete